MPRALFDEAGNQVEVPDEQELESLKSAQEEANALKEQIKAFEDGSVGMKSLREALKRKDSLIADLQKKAEAPKQEAKVEEKKEVFDEEKYRQMSRAEASKILLETEISRSLSEYSEDDKKLIKRNFDKLTAGEELNMETMSVYMEQAARAAFPSTDVRSKFSHSAGGRPPIVDDGQKKSFADSDAGRDLAARMGLKLEAPKRK
jgi:phosphomevalonate kinase